MTREGVRAFLLAWLRIAQFMTSIHSCNEHLKESSQSARSDTALSGLDQQYDGISVATILVLMILVQYDGISVATMLVLIILVQIRNLAWPREAT